MIVTKTQVLNLAYAIICAVAVLGSETSTVPFLPDAWKHYIAAAAVLALWLKGHWNLFINPDGTPAAAPYSKAGQQ